MNTRGNQETKSLLLCDLRGDFNLFDSGHLVVPFLYKSIENATPSSHVFDCIEEDDGDPEDFRRQYWYVGIIYEAILKDLTDNLNTRHGLCWSQRQWEIVIGPWLRVYLESLYYRWLRLDSLVKHGISRIYVTEKARRAPPFLVAVDRNSYTHHKILEEDWNQYMLAEMACFKFRGDDDVVIDEVPTFSPRLIDEQRGLKSAAKILSLKNRVKHLVQVSLEALSLKLSFGKKIVVNTPYLNFFDKLRLAIKLKRFPVFYFNKPHKLTHGILSARRDLQFRYSEFACDFHEFSVGKIEMEIPTCYVEQFDEMQELVGALHLPVGPDIIYTGSGVESDELIRLYIAKNIENRTKYVISQHGGVYGTRLIPTKSEFYEHRIADRWISWGWSDPENKNVIPGFNVKSIGKRRHKFCDGAIILFALPNITFVPSRLMPLQPRRRIVENIEVVRGLNESVREKLMVRAHPNHRDKPYVAAIADGCTVSTAPEFWDDLRRCRLFVTTNNSTTFLQAVVAGCPSVLVLLGRQTLVRSLSQDTFLRLEEVGVVFRDARRASQHINSIADDPEAWWRSESVQRAVSLFCNQHARVSKDGVGELAKCFD